MSLARELSTRGTQGVVRSTTRRQVARLLQVVMVADFVIVAAAIVLAWSLRFDINVWNADVVEGQGLFATLGPWIAFVWIGLIAGLGAYSPRVFGAGPEEFRLVLHASVITAGAVGMTSFLLKAEISRGFVLLTFLIGIPLLLGERYVIRKGLHRARRQGRMLRSVIAVGGPSAIAEVAEVLHRESYVGYLICGACVPQGVHCDPNEVPVPCLGTVEDIRRVCAETGADTVLVARGGYGSSAELRRIAWDLEGTDIDLVVAPSLTDVAGPRIHMRPVAGLPLLHVEGPQVDGAAGLGKRMLDFLGAITLIFLSSPLLLTVAALIKMQDGGPVLFRQARVGREGEGFAMLKFRSMVPDAERRLEQLRESNDCDDVLFKVRDDPRVTRLGRFIRRYSIDELPQLFNVFRGEMSLVGPRPPLPAEVERYEQDVHRRLLVRPGMTGLWQISGRSNLSWSEAVRLDLYYVDNWSMVSDLVIITKTVKAVLASRGAY